MVGTLASRVTGLLRNSILNQLFPREVTDAFLVALKVPNLFRELLAEGALTNSFVPVYKGLEREEARRLSGALLSLLLVVNALLVLLAVLAAPWIADLLLASGANVDYQLTVTLTRAVFPFLAAISFAALAMGILNAEERFFAPAWAPVALNVVTVVLMLLFPGRALMLAVAFVAGGAAQLAVQIPALARRGLLPRPGHWWHPQLAGVLLLMVPFAFTTGARQFLNVVASRLLSLLPEGSVTAFQNAELFLSLALGLFSISPALAYFSRLSADAVQAPEAFGRTLLAGLRLIGFLTVPAGLALWLLAEPAVQTVLNWLGAFGAEGGIDPQVRRLSVAALAPLGFAVFPVGLNNLLLRTFYVRRQARAPIVISVVFVLFNAALYALLAPRHGIVGMSWATAVTGWLQLIALLAVVGRAEALDLRAWLGHTLRVWLAAGVAAGLTVAVLARLHYPASWFDFALRAGVGLGVLGAGYLLLCALLRVPELEPLLRRLRR